MHALLLVADLFPALVMPSFYPCWEFQLWGGAFYALKSHQHVLITNVASLSPLFDVLMITFVGSFGKIKFSIPRIFQSGYIFWDIRKWMDIRLTKQ